MKERTLTLRECNRASLARQLLLERSAHSVSGALEKVAGLQAQVPNPPYIGLWTRLQDFRRGELTQLMEERKIVRAAMMRSTLHLVTSEDHQRLRPTLQPALTRALSAFFGKRARGLDIEKLVEAVRPFVQEKPRSTGEIRNLLSEVEPEADPEAMAYAVRTHLPLAQVPPAGTWGSGSRAGYTTADSWLGESIKAGNLGYLLSRYLEAFGPATVMDFQAWSGMTGLKKPVEELKPDLITFKNEEGEELLDLPDAPLPSSETSAPVRFMPEYDNLILSHSDRRRVIADEHRKEVFLSAARVRATILVDGFVRGAWSIEKPRGTARLLIEPFEPLSKQVKEDLCEEGERLLRFVVDDAGSFEVLVSEQS